MICPALLACLSAGCAAKPAEPTIDPEAWKSPHAISVQHVGSVAVAEGTPPLAYSVEQFSIVRVMDKQTGKVVARAEARPGQIVAVDAERGVLIGGEPFTRGLPADHQYMIYLDIANPEAAPVTPGSEKKTTTENDAKR